MSTVENSLSFGEAVAAMKAGCKVCRSGWNGKGMFLFLIDQDAWGFESDIEGIDGLYGAPFICMKTADNKLVPWLASQTDVISDDWIVI
jgi:hypothetical protein